MRRRWFLRPPVDEQVANLTARLQIQLDVNLNLAGQLEHVQAENAALDGELSAAEAEIVRLRQALTDAEVDAENTLRRVARLTEVKARLYADLAAAREALRTANAPTGVPLSPIETAAAARTRPAPRVHPTRDELDAMFQQFEPAFRDDLDHGAQ